MSVPAKRCWGDVSQIMADYHDREWGVPCHDDAALLERLVLEGFQAGLSWELVLRRRESFAAAFDGWDAEKIAAYAEADVQRLLDDPGIIRNRLKVRATIANAQAYLRIRAGGRSFDAFVWSPVGGSPSEAPAPLRWEDVPAVTDEARALSRSLRAEGFSFVGPTICYAFMQSVGMVNDHLVGCPAGDRLRA